MKPLFFALALTLLSTPLRAEPLTGDTPAPTISTASTPAVIDLFSVDESPGAGKIIFSEASKSETVQLGVESGFYGLGMVFNGTALPKDLALPFQKSKILQFAFGSLKAQAQSRVPQFCSLSIIASKLPVNKTTYKLVMPTGKDTAAEEMSLLLFLSPFTGNSQSDEEKLKETFFAHSGAVTLTPMGKPKAIKIKSETKLLNYKMQMMKLDVDTALVTPFNPNSRDLALHVEVPVYWPFGREAEFLARKIAQASLSAGGPIAIPQDLSKAKRK